MVKHIVMWKLKDNAEGADKEQNAKIMKKNLEALKDKISVIQHIEVGFDFVNGDASQDVMLYSEFATKEDLDIYRVHPEHVKEADFVKKVTSNRYTVDYEI